MLGGDGTRATLRGFTISGFRDRNLGVDAEPNTAFPSPIRARDRLCGCRASGAADVRAVQRYPREYGIQPQLHAEGRTLGRMDVGFGGGEGVRVFWSFGAFRL
jgi:hypothetical protein